MNKAYRSVWNEALGTWVAVQENARGRGKKSARSALVFTAITSAIGVMSATPAWAASIANSSCSPDGPGSGTWSNVAGCWANAGAAGALHNLGETVIGSYGYVPTNVSFATIFGFAGQSNALYGTSLGANGVVASGAQNSVALGAGSVATESNTVSVGRVGNNPLYNVHTSGDSTGADSAPMNQSLLGTVNRRVTNMAAGINDTDAANVSQVKGVTSALGGGAGVNSDGSVKKPTYVVQGASVSDIGSALSKLDSVVSNVNNGAGIKYFHATSTLADSVVGGANSIAIGGAAVTGAAANAIAIGANASAQGANYYDGSYSVAIGSAATDAVNVSQLQSEDAKVSAFGNNVSNLSNTVNNYAGSITNINTSVTNIVNGGGIKYFHANSTRTDSVASGTALTMIPDVDQGKTVAVGVGAGTYQGYQAAALGASARVTENIKVKLGAGISAQGTTFGAGASYQW